MKALIKNSFVTCNSNGDGKYHVELEFKTLHESQLMHRKLIAVRQGNLEVIEPKANSFKD